MKRKLEAEGVDEDGERKCPQQREESSSLLSLQQFYVVQASLAEQDLAEARATRQATSETATSSQKVQMQHLVARPEDFSYLKAISQEAGTQRALREAQIMVSHQRR
ncbi:hypothetical protein CBS101457_002673 [Exobasidium rhododendri]|nr:hypothetical protein CBS101457_002673 [Exobasidium rhododendri]